MTIRSDLPIIKCEGDLLGRRPFAERLAKYIDQLHGRGSTVIGLDGPWGSGKTSLFNMAESALSSDKTIVMRFNPWSQIGSDSIVLDFF